MPPEMFDKAEARQKQLRYPKFSEYVRALIDADISARPTHKRNPSSTEHPEAEHLLEQADELTKPLVAAGKTTSPKPKRRPGTSPKTKS